MNLVLWNGSFVEYISLEEMKDDDEAAAMSQPVSLAARRVHRYDVC